MRLTKELARRYAESLFAEGEQRGYPLAMSHLAVQLMMKKAGLPVPRDVLAFASNGIVSDADVKDWNQPETP